MNRDKSKLKEEDNFDFDDFLSQYKKTLGYSAKAKKKTYKRNKAKDETAWKTPLFVCSMYRFVG